MFHFGDLFIRLGFGPGRGDARLLVELLGLFEQARLFLLAQGVRDLGVGRVQGLDGQADQFNAEFFLRDGGALIQVVQDSWPRKAY